MIITRKHAVLAVSILVASNLSYAATLEESTRICNSDVLYHDHAIGRNAWEVYCGHMSMRTYKYYKYADDSGSIRLKAYYNAYYYVDDPNKKFMAPVSSRTAQFNCSVPTNVESVVCSSLILNFPGPIIDPGPDPEKDF
ncbi:hypothetical protein PCIT_b0300 [Pseudoalteromonas citrea]|uniref:DUF3757 domain-containing protein n=2 Tax=Pseudoalteromonas citrea TaxID=43655 RepID=A0AAD4FPT4_9GAMM|nr:hypothetical protein [Pseudoalteromonas citrea]KAF7764328.1 hypothetical protein PCIT_b0300 [Pseudoalteromonas citrea]